MRVVLNVIDGPHKGQHRVLQAGQVLRIGRSDWAELSCEKDESLSRLHFELKSTPEGCELVDLKSRNGTRVNGRPIERVLVRDGDEIEAGVSKFKLQVSGDNPASSLNSALRYVEPVADAKLAAGLKGRLVARCEKKTQQNGWTLYRGQVEDVAPEILMDLLQQNTPLYLLFDPNRAETPLADEQPAYIFDHLPVESASQVSPVFLNPANGLGWKPLISAAWEKDAVIALFSAAAPDQLLGDFRKACRTGVGDAVLGICWPHLLGAVLSISPADVLDKYLPGVSFVLLESGDDPKTWILASPTPLDETLRRFGVSCQNPGPPTATVMPAIKG